MLFYLLVDIWIFLYNNIIVLFYFLNLILFLKLRLLIFYFLNRNKSNYFFCKMSYYLLKNQLICIFKYQTLTYFFIASILLWILNARANFLTFGSEDVTFGSKSSSSSSNLVLFLFISTKSKTIKTTLKDVQLQKKSINS